MDLSKIQAEIDAAAVGALIRVAPGTYTGTLTISKAVTLVASGAALFDAGNRDSVIRIDAPGSAALSRRTSESEPFT